MNPLAVTITARELQQGMLEELANIDRTRYPYRVFLPDSSMEDIRIWCRDRWGPTDTVYKTHYMAIFFADADSYTEFMLSWC